MADTVRTHHEASTSAPERRGAPGVLPRRSWLLAGRRRRPAYEVAARLGPPPSTRNDPITAQRCLHRANDEDGHDVAALQLVDRRRARLDAPVARYRPEFADSMCFDRASTATTTRFSAPGEPCETGPPDRVRHTERPVRYFFLTRTIYLY